jgi:hypothetical protein
MSGLPRGDFNMSPGVSASDIPGNRPGDNRCDNECGRCGGSGYLEVDVIDGVRPGSRMGHYKACPECEGKGIIW